MKKLFRTDLDKLTPYKPILPFDVLSEQLGIPIDEIVKLDANENPYGASPRAKAAIANAEFIHIYPDPESRHLRQALSDYLDVPIENLLVGNGADELLDMIMRLFIDAGDAIINMPPTFGMYPIDARRNRAEIISVPRRADFSPDVPAIEKAVADNPRAKLLFVTSPNNPDGGIIAPETLARLLKLPLIIVLDEAYTEFSTQNFTHDVLAHPNLIVLRTFSKWAGLAGLRVGYGVFPLPIAEALWRIKEPYNMNVLAQKAAIASLEDLDYLMANVHRLIETREKFLADIQEISWLTPYPTQSNFVLLKVHGHNPENVRQLLMKQGILLRNYNAYGLGGHLRVSMGKAQDMARLINTLKTLQL